MNANRKSVDDFRRIYYDEFGEQLTEEEAKRVWLDLMDFMTLLFKKTSEEMGQSSSERSPTKPIAADDEKHR